MKELSLPPRWPHLVTLGVGALLLWLAWGRFEAAAAHWQADAGVRAGFAGVIGALLAVKGARLAWKALRKLLRRRELTTDPLGDSWLGLIAVVMFVRLVASAILAVFRAKR